MQVHAIALPAPRPHRADAGAGNIKISPPRVSSLFSRSSSIYTLWSGNGTHRQVSGTFEDHFDHFTAL